MRLGYATNGRSCEYDMQSKLSKWLSSQNMEFIDEFYIPEIKRRPDFLIITGGQLINIEAKCNNHEEMMRQLRDNAKYCNYSFAYIPNYCLTSLEFKKQLLSSGFGLIVYNYGNNIVTEVLEAHHNEAHDKVLKKTIIERIRRELKLRNSRRIIDTQQNIF